jgi:hypothetical protein
MMRPNLTKSSLAFVLVFAIGRSVSAEERCSLRGSPDMAQAVGIYDAPTDGTELGHFTGAKVALSVLAFAEGNGGRSLVETAGFRIKGYVRTRDIPVYTARPIPVYAGHVFIGEGRRVSVVGGAPGRLHVERAAAAPLAGVFQGWAQCDAVSLTAKGPPGFSPPGGARGYLVKRGKLDIFEKPRGDLVASMSKAGDGPGVLFWGTDSADGFVHVERRRDIVVDAWARASDLVPLPAGETADQSPEPPVESIVPKLQLQGRARVVRTTTAVALRAAATEGAVAIGGIDAGVEIVVVDVVAGWASVVPSSLAVAPSGAGQFWVHARDLGI